MRDYSKVSGTFWTGKTGRGLRGDMQTQLVALYLMTSPHANMIGVFHCPVIYIAHETGSPLEGAIKGLKKLCEGGFCAYDEDSETVWVHEMAKFQIGDDLKPNDNRVKDIQKQYESMPESRIKSGFLEKYGACYHIADSKPLRSPSEAPPKPEAGTEAEAEAEAGTSIGADKPRKPATKPAPLPADFYPNETGVEYAEKRNVTLAVELESFRNWHQAKGTTMKDWQAAWRTWCDKAVEFGRAGVTANGARASPQFDARSQDRKRAIAEMTGKTHEPRIIEREINPALRLAAAGVG